jgi:hypothetical protein
MLFTLRRQSTSNETEIKMTCVSISFMGSGFGTFIGCGGDGTVHRKNYIQQLD